MFCHTYVVRVSLYTRLWWWWCWIVFPRLRHAYNVIDTICACDGGGRLGYFGPVNVEVGVETWAVHVAPPRGYVYLAQGPWCAVGVAHTGRVGVAKGLTLTGRDDFKVYSAVDEEPVRPTAVAHHVATVIAVIIFQSATIRTGLDVNRRWWWIRIIYFCILRNN